MCVSEGKGEGERGRNLWNGVTKLLHEESFARDSMRFQIPRLPVGVEALID